MGLVGTPRTQASPVQAALEHLCDLREDQVWGNQQVRGDDLFRPFSSVAGRQESVRLIPKSLPIQHTIPYSMADG